MLGADEAAPGGRAAGWNPAAFHDSGMSLRAYRFFHGRVRLFPEIT
jgi:hypothetical protein